MFSAINAPFVEKRFDECRLWDWYCCSYPHVTRYRNRTVFEPLDQLDNIPAAKSDLPAEWRSINHPDFLDVQWTHSQVVPSFVCNGLKIGRLVGDEFKYPEIPAICETEFVSIVCPSLSVYDPDANLPLTLQRDDLGSRTLPFCHELAVDVIKDIIAYLAAIMLDPSGDRVQALHVLRYPGIHTKANSLIPGVPCEWFTTADGIGIVDRWTIATANIRRAILFPMTTMIKIIYPTKFGHSIPPSILESADGLFGCYMEGGLSSELRFIRELHAKRESFRGIRLLIANELAEKVKNHRQLSAELKESLVMEWSNDKWSLVSMGSCPETGVDVSVFEDDSEGVITSPRFIVEVFLSDSYEDDGSSLVGQVWKEVVKVPVIPLEENERRIQLPHVFANLKEYIDCHRDLQENLGYWLSISMSEDVTKPFSHYDRPNRKQPSRAESKRTKKKTQR